MKNLCETCINRCGIVFNAKWNPLTGEVMTNPKYVCKLSNHVEDKTDCKNYKNKETKFITCATCQYADSKAYGKPDMPFCYAKKHHVTPTVDREDCEYYLESPKSYWQRQKENKTE